jgi:hypothetical protein
MAEIRSYPFLRHLRAEPTSHVVYFKRGTRKKSGPGLSFWFGPLGASLAEVPLEDRDIAFLIAGRSADFQDVHVNGVVTFRVIDADLLAQRVDFSIDTKTGRFRSEPLDKLTGIVVNLAQQLVAGFLSKQPLSALLADGVDGIRTAIDAGLANDPGLRSLGIGIVATRVSSLKPSADVEKALQMPARERIQQSADEATFARRALAVEKERAIQQNELSTKIELAKREEQLISQRGQNEKKRILDQTEAEAIAVTARLKNERLAAEGEAEGIRLREGARVEAESNRVAIYREMPPAAMMGLAAHELAGKLQTIEHLSLSPDMLGTLLERVLGAQARKLETRS